jgi:hypothetical protein
MAGVALSAPASHRAGAAPSNKNTEVIHATCNTGKNIRISVVHTNNKTTDLVSADPVVGGGSVKVASFTAFELGTTNVVFSATSHYGGLTKATSNGTISEGGEAFDFVVRYISRTFGP